MEIVWKNPAAILPFDHNPRLNDSAVAAVAASIREFGFRQPIVVDRDWVIIAGHTRHKAALSLGLESVPVVVANDLSPNQIRAYRIADNKTGELAEWNFDLLATELAELTETSYGGLLGFSEDELSKLLGQVSEPAQGQEPEPVPTSQAPVDVWLLGEHRLHCADAGRPADLEQLIEFLVAADQISRQACVFERSATTCDSIKSRWEKLTGRTAQRMAPQPAAPEPPARQSARRSSRRKPCA